MFTDTQILALAATRVHEDDGRFHRAFEAARKAGKIPSYVSEREAREALGRAIERSSR